MKIQISPRILESATSFFNVDWKVILQELLQNARRAGATRVDITTEQLKVDYSKGTILTRLTIEDNGCGIFKDGVAIALGQSNWSPEVIDRENPAGCGLFSLSQGCTIESNGYSITLDREAFQGLKEVEVHTVPPKDYSYTKITYLTSLPRPFPMNLQSDCIQWVAKNYDLPIYIDGHLIKHVPYLEDCQYTVELDDYVIGFGENQTLKTYLNPALNYFGLIVKDVISSPYSFICAVKIEVKTGAVRLTLPQRNVVIKDEAYQRLCADVYREYYKYLLEFNKCSTCFTDEEEDWAYQQCGLSIEPLRLYSLVEYSACIDPYDYNPKLYHATAEELNTLKVFVDPDELLLTFLNEVLPESKYYTLRSHAHPRALKRKLVKPKLEVLVNNEWIEAEECSTYWVEKFRLAYTVIDDNSTYEAYDELDLDYAVIYEDYCCDTTFEGTFLFTTREFPSIEDIATLVTDIGFTPSDSGDSDLEYAEYLNSVKLTLTGLLHGDDAERKLRLEQLIESNLSLLQVLLKKDETITISRTNYAIQ